MFRSIFKVPVPNRPAVEGGKTRICVAGFGISHNTGRAQKLAATIARIHPDKYETWFYFSTFCYKEFLKSFIQNEIPHDQKSQLSTLDSDRTIGSHQSAPFVWFETADGIVAVGGRDKFCEWAAKEFPENEAIQALAGIESPPLRELFFDSTTPGGTWMKN